MSIQGQGGKAVLRAAIVAFVGGVAAFGELGGQATAATDATEMNSLGSTTRQTIVDPVAEPGAGANPVTRPVAPTGNPLWAVPLRSLSVTRDRPIFSPSRRPPPPVVISAPPIEPVRLPVRPAEPERPQLALVGTVVGGTTSIGVFFDQSAKTVVRLRLGEGLAGWILRSVQQREATLEKNNQTVILVLPPPGAAPAANGPLPRAIPTPDVREL